MFENVVSGWKIASAIRKLALQDRGLLLYPIISAVIMIIEAIAVFVPLALLSLGAYSSYGGSYGILFIIALFVYYVVVYFTATYVLVAMLLAFRSYEDGSKMGIGAAFSKASSYSVVILEWALFEAIVTMVIRAIEQRLGALGGIIFGLAASIAMSIATAFAVPVIVDKRTGPISTLKESTGFIIKNFGKTFGGLLFTDLYAMIFSFIGLGLIFVAFLSISVSIVVAVIIVVIGVIFMLYGAMLNYILGNIYKFVLYDVENGGKVPKGLTKDLLMSGVRQKKNRGSGGILGGNMPGGFGGPM